jgi:hypothetical protein
MEGTKVSLSIIQLNREKLGYGDVSYWLRPVSVGERLF